MNKELSSKITNANVLFTIFVVCLHARPSNLGVYHIVGTIADAAVPNFFVISSYLYFSSFCWEETCKSYFSKIKKKNMFSIDSLFNILCNRFPCYNCKTSF